MASGGDDYDTLASGANLVDTNRLVRDAIEAHVRAASADGGALEPVRDGRIREVGAPDPAETAAPR